MGGASDSIDPRAGAAGPPRAGVNSAGGLQKGAIAPNTIAAIPSPSAPITGPTRCGYLPERFVTSASESVAFVMRMSCTI
jgi:hypothetical protein